MVLGDAIALACSFFEPLAIHNPDFSPDIGDQLFLFQLSRRKCHRTPRHPQHVRKKLLRHLEDVCTGPVCGDQQPSCQPLVEVMYCIATSGLRCLHQLGLHVSQRKPLERFTARKLR